MQSIPWRRRLRRWATEVALGARPLLAAAGEGGEAPGSHRGFEPRGETTPGAVPGGPGRAEAGAPGGGSAGAGADPETADGEGEAPPPQAEEAAAKGRGRRGIAGKVKTGLVSVVASSYDARADDLEERAVRAMRRALVEERGRIAEVAREVYDARADDIQRRAADAIREVLAEESHRMLEVIQRAYDARAGDLQERAAAALRNAIAQESDRIRQTIEFSVEVKRREVRISLTVLVVANLIYLVVYWVTHGGR